MIIKRLWSLSIFICIYMVIHDRFSGSSSKQISDRLYFPIINQLDFEIESLLRVQFVIFFPHNFSRAIETL